VVAPIQRTQRSPSPSQYHRYSSHKTPEEPSLTPQSREHGTKQSLVPQWPAVHIPSVDQLSRMTPTEIHRICTALALHRHASPPLGTSKRSTF
jgi:hypothetical protein